MCSMEHAEVRPHNSPIDTGTGRRRLGLKSMLLLGFVALIAIPALTYYAWTHHARLKFESQVRKLEEMGAPATAETLNEFYALPEKFIDSTKLYLEASEAVVSDSFKEASEGIPAVSFDVAIPEPGEVWPQMDKIKNLVGEFQTTLDVLHRAAEQGGHARFNIEFEEGYNALLEHVQNLRQVVRFQQVETILHTHNKDAVKTTAALAAGFATATCLKNEPVVVSQLVSIACVRLMLTSLEDALAKVDFSDAQLAELQSVIQKIDFRISYKNAWKGERALAFINFRDPTWKDLEEQGWNDPKTRLLLVTSARFNDLSGYSEATDTLIESLDEPWPVAIENVVRMTQGVESASTERWLLKKSPITESLSGAFRSLKAAAAAEAQLEVANTLLALRRFTLAKGELPESLEQLEPEWLSQTPIDPFTLDQPLRFTKVEDPKRASPIAIVYSIGRDGVDNNGSQHVPDPMGESIYPHPEDIVMKLLPVSSQKE